MMTTDSRCKCTDSCRYRNRHDRRRYVSDTGADVSRSWYSETSDYSSDISWRKLDGGMLNTLKEGVDKLVDGIQQLQAGYDKVDEGTSSLLAGTNTLTASNKQLTSGATALESSGKTLTSGASKLTSASKQLNSEHQRSPVQQVSLPVEQTHFLQTAANSTVEQASLHPVHSSL